MFNLWKLIHYWLDSINAPSEFTSYFNKFKGLLIQKLLYSTDAGNNNDYDELEHIIKKYKKIIKTYAPFGKIKYQKFNTFMEEIEESCHLKESED